MNMNINVEKASKKLAERDTVTYFNMIAVDDKNAKELLYDKDGNFTEEAKDYLRKTQDFYLKVLKDCEDSFNVSITSKNGSIPKYKTSGAAGCDLVYAEDTYVTIEPGERVLLNTGMKMSIPSGYEGQVRTRSGLALKEGLVVLNSPGTIDSDYRGEIGIILYNSSNHTRTVHPGDRIAQMVFAKVEKAKFILKKELDEDTDRGEGGFGSTGKN